MDRNDSKWLLISRGLVTTPAVLSIVPKRSTSTCHNRERIYSSSVVASLYDPELYLECAHMLIGLAPGGWSHTLTIYPRSTFTLSRYWASNFEVTRQWNWGSHTSFDTWIVPVSTENGSLRVAMSLYQFHGFANSSCPKYQARLLGTTANLYEGRTIRAKSDRMIFVIDWLLKDGRWMKGSGGQVWK